MLMASSTCEHGAPVSVPPGTLSSKQRSGGLAVPHYCYHRAARRGVCRMCLVEIEKAPKLADRVRDDVTEAWSFKTQAPRPRCAPELLDSCSSIIRSIAPSRPGASASCNFLSRRQPGTVLGSSPKRSIRRDFGPDCCTSPIAAFCARVRCASWRTWRKNPAQRLRARRPRLHRHSFPRRGSPPLGAMSRSLSRGLACSQGFPAQGACLGARQTGVDLHRPARRVQHPRSIRGTKSSCGCARARTSTSTVLHLRSRPHALSVDESPATASKPRCAHGRRVARHRLGRSLSRC